MKDIFRGEMVRITAEEPEERAKMEARWQRDTEVHRLADSEPAMLTSRKKLKEWFEKQTKDGFSSERYLFSVRTLDGNKHIGFFVLVADLMHGEAWVGIGIGEREFWGKGYGTDMMKVCLRYAFTELNVHRVSLGVHAYNPRAVRSYEKAGFQIEGRTRKDILREGRRYDGIWMGILHEEWLQMQNGDQP
jgi:RimJ/RimL family protein N-acetyltransferase